MASWVLQAWIGEAVGPEPVAARQALHASRGRARCCCCARTHPSTTLLPWQAHVHGRPRGRAVGHLGGMPRATVGCIASNCCRPGHEMGSMGMLGPCWPCHLVHGRAHAHPRINWIGSVAARCVCCKDSTHAQALCRSVETNVSESWTT